jgi:hypothetical protein
MRKITLLAITVLFCSAIFGQQDYWTSRTVISGITTDKAVARQTFPKNFKLFDLTIDRLKQELFSVTNKTAQSTVISLPNAEGTIEKFEVFEASNFVPDLQARFPLIRAFSGRGITDKFATLKLSISPQGIQTMVFRTDKENEFIEPWSQDHSVYAVFKSYREQGKLPWTCTTEDKNFAVDIKSQIPPVILSSSGELKTMRLAQSCTAEYSNFFGATSSAQVGLVLAAFNATLTRANGCYEKDLALHLNLISNVSDVIYYDPATDPYSDAGAGAGGAWHAELQGTLTSVIGEANYDIGHLFGATGGGGNAGCIGCVCVNGIKGRGFTSPADGIPQGDNFDIDYVVHEVGHQLGGSHTFSHDNEGPSPTQKEVGSGITIMGYAGITAQDVAPHSIDIYHETSIAQIQANLAGKTCPTNLVMTANHPPVVAGVSNRTIPISTPFALTGSATDPESDPITYCWEQNDVTTTFGASSVASPTKTTGPNWLSFSPTASGTRIFPKLSTILSGLFVTPPLPGGDAGANIEALSSVARTLNFRLTARDNHPYIPGSTIGQTAFTDMVVTVDGTKGPFAVTSPNTAVSWCPGPQTVTWSVNGSNTLAANINILLSYDGGNSFPVTLAANTANDGSESVTIPCTHSTTARIKIEAVGNIFFDISNANFTTGDNTAPTFTKPANITINKDANCNYNASTAMTGDVTDENDNCDNTLDATFSDVTANGSCVGEIIITRTWTLTDDCGNSTVKVQTITITDNTAPTFTKPANITIYKDANCNFNASTAITGDVTDEDDNCDHTLNATFSDATAAGSCDGETIITRTWTLTDDCSNSTVKVQTITVKDNTPPTFTDPADITIYKDNNCNHDASVAVTGDVTDEHDNCDNTLNAVFTDVNVAGSCIGEVIITRTWTLMDDCGNTAIPKNQIITVKDTTRPVISGVSANPSILWPPNHKMVLVTINYTVQDNCSPVAAIINSIAAVSNEPENGTGDGDTGPDMIVKDNHHVWLRAERKGNGTGRIYTVTITSTDDCGNTATTTVNVYVPHDMSMPVTAKSYLGATENNGMNAGMTVKAMPNPSSSFFSVTVSSDNDREKIEVMIYDLYGRKLEQFNISNGSTVMVGEKYRPGVYMVRIQQGANHKEMKLIKLSE